MQFLSDLEYSMRSGHVTDDGTHSKVIIDLMHLSMLSRRGGGRA